MSRFPTFLAFPVVALAACGPDVRIDDDLSGPAVSLFGLGDNNVHQPYALGASFGIEVVTTGDPAELVVESTDPAVLEIGALAPHPDPENEDTYVAAARTVSEGEVVIEVRHRRGRLLESQAVRVAAPDRVVLVPVPQAIAAIDSQGTIDPETIADATPTLVRGSHVDVVLVPYDGEDQLFGAQDPGITADDPARIVSEPGAFAANRLYDVVYLEAVDVGAGSVTVSLASGDFPLPYEVVPPDAVDRIEILGSEVDSDVGTDVMRVLVGYTAANDPVYGVHGDWTVDGVALTPSGDVLSFGLDDGALVPIVAVSGDLQAAVQASAREPVVLDATEVSTCSHAGSTTTIAALAASLALVARRRRINR
jgi:hypothetical protein